MLDVVAAWAGIIALPLTAVGTLVGVASVGRQRGLRQHLREVLDQVFNACNEYQYSNKVFLTEQFLRTSAEKLRILSARDGLKSPNANHLGQLRDILRDVAGRFDIPNALPGHGISQQHRAELLQANQDHMDDGIEQAKRRSAAYIRAVNKMDGWHYWTYLRFRWFGTTSRTFGDAGSDFHPWPGPVA
jgi:hypothetical protein